MSGASPNRGAMRGFYGGKAPHHQLPTSASQQRKGTRRGAASSKLSSSAELTDIDAVSPVRSRATTSPQRPARQQQPQRRPADVAQTTSRGDFYNGADGGGDGRRSRPQPSMRSDSPGSDTDTAPDAAPVPVASSSQRLVQASRAERASRELAGHEYTHKLLAKEVELLTERVNELRAEAAAERQRADHAEADCDTWRARHADARRVVSELELQLKELAIINRRRSEQRADSQDDVGGDDHERGAPVTTAASTAFLRRGEALQQQSQHRQSPQGRADATRYTAGEFRSPQDDRSFRQSPPRAEASPQRQHAYVDPRSQIAAAAPQMDTIAVLQREVAALRSERDALSRRVEAADARAAAVAEEVTQLSASMAALRAAKTPLASPPRTATTRGKQRQHREFLYQSPLTAPAPPPADRRRVSTEPSRSVCCRRGAVLRVPPHSPVPLRAVPGRERRAH
jgi:FtsZ-binding cell division protein ZapB